MTGRDRAKVEGILLRHSIIHYRIGCNLLPRFESAGIMELPRDVAVYSRMYASGGGGGYIRQFQSCLCSVEMR